jgi:acyl-CoA synthetase (AMP-forming)/AMP-acid ligase II
MWVYPEIRTLGDITRYHRRHRPDDIAVVTPIRSLSFAALDAASSGIARSLRNSIEGRSARIGYFGRNHAETAELVFGAAKAGFALMPLNWRLAPAEIAVLLDDAECELLFVDEALEPVMREALARMAIAPRVVVFDPAGGNWLAGFVGAHTGEDPNFAVEESATALHMYTSGTTGVPKGVELVHGAFNYMRLIEHLDPATCWRPGETFLMFMPNFHMAGIGWLIQSLYNGMTVSMLPQFDPSIVLAAIRATRPALTILVPTTLQMLLDHPDAAGTDFTCFKLVVYAGSPMPLPLIVRALEIMKCGFLNCYGATELLSTATWLRPDQHDLQNPERLKSVGTACQLVSIRLLDEHGREVAPGEVGEIVVRMAPVFKGYWKKPEQTAAALQNGWYRTGDAAYRDEEGFYFLKDRIKDMIVSGGENIYSSEVEQALHKHEDVIDAAVIGVPDQRWGEAVMALVQRRPGGTVDAEGIVRFCRQYIAGYKLPKRVEFVDGFPRTPSGKIQKAKLRAAFARPSGEQT